MGALTNNSRKLANFAGFYKGIQSAGAAVVFALDYNRIPFLSMFATCWALLAGSLLVAWPLIWYKIPLSVSLEDDLKFSDETFGEVAPVRAVGDVRVYGNGHRNGNGYGHGSDVELQGMHGSKRHGM